MKKILLIIPAYNEEESIVNTYNSIVKYNEENNTGYDVIVINDGSIDRTQQVCEMNKIPLISLVHNLGIGGAVQTGYKYAYENNYDVAVQFDGDGQHNVECVPHIVQPIINNECEFVIGSRFIDGAKSSFQSSLSRRMGIKLVSIAIKLTTHKLVRDTTSGFRACGKELIEEFAQSYPLEYPEPITTTEVLRKGHKIKEIAVEMNERVAGESSINSWKSLYYMINVLLSIFVVGIRRNK